eukprot:CAMPEP_0116021404 /NCGR_PEP_ID=MMETSP0321-20121206/10368_1 /TAXON_ID=163516 /ORGANISM="Leptocylindrus danicus var. danicus, Strain B650" /LENGTH=272 /DNA_ID=CAMNT_0003492271 /DNA_START=110 /DNA_END=928 /DNA_ORIENTATION=+
MRITYLGCRWSYIVKDGDEGCREDESGDGTQYWYQMANCRRANVAFAVYGADSGSTRCSKGQFLENFVTTKGLVDFAYDMNNYDYNNNPLTYDDIADLPTCQYQNGYYQSVGCTSDGHFTVDNFNDQYCTQYVSTSNNLKTLNKALSKISCHDCMVNSGDDDNYGTLCASLLYNADVCSYLDSSLCSNPNGNKKIKGSTQSASRAYQDSSSGGSSIGNKLKYFFGTVFLAASFAMFLGILFTNRRKRRALLFRRSQSRSKRSSSRRHEGEFA